VVIANNTVGTTQFGIVTVSDPSSSSPNNPHGAGDHTTITNNQVLNTQIFDAIDACSNFNTIQGNAIANATESAIHLDSSCGETGVNNNVKANLINETCAGILVGATPNTIGSNAFFNVVNTQLTGNTCPANSPTVAAATTALAVGGTARPRPAR
jgi:hypothetical protein